MHILFLTDNFPPEVNAPASRTFEHCREWVREGHQVTVITCAPNFPKGRVFSGYKNRIWQQETMAGIRVIRVWTYITANEGFARRTIDYLSYMVSGFLASLFVKRVDIVVGTSPQFFTACAAFLVGLVKRVPWVFELRDIWPESIRAVGAMKKNTTISLLEKVEIFLYRRADAIVSVTQSFRNSLIHRGVAGAKIHVVLNGVDSAQFSPREPDIELIDRYGLEGKFVAGYIGTHGLAHGLDTLLDAAKMLKNSPDENRFRFIFLGDGARKESLVTRARDEELDNVIFLDSVPKDQVARYWSLLNVSVIHLKREKLFTTVIPSKIFECMSMEIPILHGVEGESADIVLKEDVGVLFEPENPTALIASLARLADDKSLHVRLKKNGSVAARRYNRSAQARKMLKVLVQQIE